jgi:hypothetical protein
MRIIREEARQKIFMPTGAMNQKADRRKKGKQRRFYPDLRTPGAEWECEKNKKKKREKRSRKTT